MSIVETYRNHIRQASELAHKQQLADEVHQLANSLDETQQHDYQ